MTPRTTEPARPGRGPNDLNEFLWKLAVLVMASVYEAYSLQADKDWEAGDCIDMARAFADELLKSSEGMP